MSTRSAWILLVVVLLVGAGAYYFLHRSGTPATQVSGIEALFTCDAGKTADATFYEGTSTPPTAPGGPPTPGGSVHLVLSDGRDMTLAQTISADGARYATADESFVFWNVGDTATITENGTSTFANCVDENNQ